MKRRTILFGLIILLLAAAYAGWTVYGWIYHPNTVAAPADPVLFVHEDGTFGQLVDDLSDQGIVINQRSFEWVAKRMKFGDLGLKEGRYVIDSVMSNYDLIHKLRLGEQDPLDLVISTGRTLEDVAGRIAHQLAMDSIELIYELEQVYLPESDYSAETLLTLIIPNTYEVYWNVTPRELINRLEREHAAFWEPRKALAEKWGLSEAEVYTLASIVERETQAKEEKPTIAGVYLNRLRRGMRLQADPTVLFALNDFTIRRVLRKHLKVDSPYNTYKYKGLPPGPITMPSMSSIEAVLQAEEHNYLYFCAMPDKPGYHAFATNLLAHNRNARAYQRWLNRQGIR